MISFKQEVAEVLNSMREVSVIMHYGVHDHNDIISPNTVSFPSITDMIDKSCMKTMRQLWLDALSRGKNDDEGKILDAGTSIADKFEKMLTEAISPREKDMTSQFVKAAAYPVPSAYAVKLPLHSKDLRLEIINTLVPFQKTREMLLRLEKTLEAPMRALQIGHSPINDVEALRASGTVVSGAKLIYN
ncbi:MAG: hypothetical protein DI626_06895 [Micavibrio aeruginosavorus]|uniref:Uncharacterized protein n=1 Tax=Micavibrio aeruginosavorus TaxID=349221 RepID=A0A2W4ZV06_9BACT|nr:MAG: hypothetical protein DI626_06895 [Micavibrio aeruginosavorus]